MIRLLEPFPVMIPTSPLVCVWLICACSCVSHGCDNAHRTWPFHEVKMNAVSSHFCLQTMTSCFSIERVGPIHYDSCFRRTFMKFVTSEYGNPSSSGIRPEYAACLCSVCVVAYESENVFLFACLSLTVPRRAQKLVSGTLLPKNRSGS